MDPNGEDYEQRMEELERMSQAVKMNRGRFAQQCNDLDRMYVTNGTHTELHRTPPVWDRSTRMHTRTFVFTRVDSQTTKLTRCRRSEVKHAFKHTFDEDFERVIVLVRRVRARVRGVRVITHTPYSLLHVTALLESEVTTRRSK
jgi:hypothetical protein